MSKRLDGWIDRQSGVKEIKRERGRERDRERETERETEVFRIVKGDKMNEK